MASSLIIVVHQRKGVAISHIAFLKTLFDRTIFFHDFRDNMEADEIAWGGGEEKKLALLAERLVGVVFCPDLLSGCQARFFSKFSCMICSCDMRCWNI